MTTRKTRKSIQDYEKAQIRAEVHAAVVSGCSGTTEEQVEPFIEWVEAATCAADHDLRMFCLVEVGKHWRLFDPDKLMRRVQNLHTFAIQTG